MAEQPQDEDYEARLFELLAGAAQWPEDELLQRAEKACEGGPVPADELLQALHRRARLGDFLENPAWEEHGDLVEGGAEPPADPAPRIGDRIGRYRLQEALGQGGMGQVYLAEQEEPRRQVALKLVRPDTLSEVALTRFRAEQQALARLNHPHVAQFHEADITPDGQPYFAMEWVDGRPIDAFLKDRPPDLTERLRIFLDICAAVRHAHQKQIAHRDLKPTNILVREVDGQPVAKVIDFGIAETLDRPLGEVRRTESGGIYGTPEFLSPESFDGDVDTRADIYSLGVLLYELVSGTRPFRRQSGDVPALIERIRLGGATPPSVAMGSKQGLELSTPADFACWAGRLRGDLDAIVGKAMHADRNQRYDAVADLSHDVERFLAHEPVAARPAGTWHQLRLLARRRRGPMLALAVALASIVLGTFAATFGLLRAQREAEATRRALEESEELSQFLTDLFEETDPGQARDLELTTLELLDQGAERLQGQLLQGQPKTRARLSRTIGDIYAKLGHYEQAEALLKESLSLFQEEFGATHPEVAEALHSLAVMHTKADQPQEAAAFFERALAVQESRPDTEPSRLAVTVYHLGVLAYRADDWDQAETYFDRACGLRSEAPDDDELTARCLQAYGALRQQQKLPDEAEGLYRRSLELRQRNLGVDHPHVAGNLESLCTLYTERLQLEAAEEACAGSLSIRRQALGSRHFLVAGSLGRLAAVHRMQQRYDEAETLFAEARAIVEQPDVSPRRQARLWVRSGWVSWLRGHYGEAEERYRHAFSKLDSTLESGTSTAGTALLGIGLSLWKQGHLETAEEELLRAHDYFLEHFGPESSYIAWASWGLAGVYRDRQDPSRDDLDRAGELYRQALKIRRRLYPEGHEYLVLTENDYEEYLARIPGGTQGAGSDEG